MSIVPEQLPTTTTSSTRVRRSARSQEATLERGIINTIREPFVVLDADWRVVTANFAFCCFTGTSIQKLEGREIFEVANGAWDAAELRSLLTNLAPGHAAAGACNVRLSSGLHRRSMRLAAERIFFRGSPDSQVILRIEPDTKASVAERNLRSLVAEKDNALHELHHRLINNVQVLASILSLKARSAHGEEARRSFLEAHQHVMSVAAVHQQLLESKMDAMVDVAPYLSRLCGTLASSLALDERHIAVEVIASSRVMPSLHVTNIGLIVTELLVNAFKHAFPSSREAGTVIVRYQGEGQPWSLSVSDDGIGGSPGHEHLCNQGAGMKIIAALAQQIHAQVVVRTSGEGTSISIIEDAPPLASSIAAEPTLVRGPTLPATRGAP